MQVFIHNKFKAKPETIIFAFFLRGHQDLEYIIPQIVQLQKFNHLEFKTSSFPKYLKSLKTHFNIPITSYRVQNGHNFFSIQNLKSSNLVHATKPNLQQQSLLQFFKSSSLLLIYLTSEQNLCSIVWCTLRTRPLPNCWPYQQKNANSLSNTIFKSCNNIWKVDKTRVSFLLLLKQRKRKILPDNPMEQQMQHQMPRNLKGGNRNCDAKINSFIVFFV